MKILDWFRKKGLDPKQNNSTISFGQYVFPEWRIGGGVEAFTTNADVYAIVSLAARKASSIPWYVFKKKTDSKAKISLDRYRTAVKSGNIVDALKYRSKAYDDQDVIENNALSKLISRPNPTQGQDQFFETAFGYRLISGESDIWLNRGISNGYPIEMYVLPTNKVSLVPDPNDLYGVTGWVLETAPRLNMAKEDVIQWKSWNPEFDQFTRIHQRGFSPLKAAYKTLMMNVEANKAGVSMFANGGAKGALIPGQVGNMVPSFTPDQASNIRDTINRSLNSSEYKSAVTVLQTRWDYLNFGLTSVDMDLLESLKLTREQLCQVFGIPAVLFSTDSMTDNNYQNAQRDLVTNLIVPLLSTLRDELNRVLAYGQDYYLDFDVSQLPELQRDFDKQVSALAQAYWLTPNEKRISIGYEPLEDVNMNDVYVNSGLIKIGDVSIDMNDGQDMGDI